jgi:hypothetical protein
LTRVKSCNPRRHRLSLDITQTKRDISIWSVLRQRQTFNNFQRHEYLHAPSTESSSLELNQRITHRPHPT